jgi:hypothetical protein
MGDYQSVIYACFLLMSGFSVGWLLKVTDSEPLSAWWLLILPFVVLVCLSALDAGKSWFFEPVELFGGWRGYQLNSNHQSDDR